MNSADPHANTASALLQRGEFPGCVPTTQSPQRPQTTNASSSPSQLVGAAALSKLFREQYRPLLRFCRTRIPNLPEAEDIVQDAFLSVGRAYPDKTEYDLKRLLFTAVRNFSASYLKSGRHRASLKSSDIMDNTQLFACPRTPTPEHRLEARQQLDAAEQAIANLPERSRTVLQLHRYEKLTYRQIADQLSVSETTVKTDLASAIAQITTHLDRVSRARMGRQPGNRHT